MANDYGKPPFPARLFLCWVGGDAHGAHSFFLDFIYCSTVTVLRPSAESIEDRCKGVKYCWLAFLWYCRCWRTSFLWWYVCHIAPNGKWESSILCMNVDVAQRSDLSYNISRRQCGFSISSFRQLSVKLASRSRGNSCSRVLLRSLAPPWNALEIRLRSSWIQKWWRWFGWFSRERRLSFFFNFFYKAAYLNYVMRSCRSWSPQGIVTYSQKIKSMVGSSVNH